MLSKMGKDQGRNKVVFFFVLFDFGLYFEKLGGVGIEFFGL